MNRKNSPAFKQNDSQSERDTALLVAVIAGYCISLTHLKLEVAVNLNFQKMFFHFTYKLHLINKNHTLLQEISDWKKAVFQGKQKKFLMSKSSFYGMKYLFMKK